MATVDEHDRQRSPTQTGNGRRRSGDAAEQLAALPAMDADPIEQLGWLAGVDAATMRAALTAAWPQGDADDALARVAARLHAYRNRYALQAAARRCAQPARQADVPELVAELRLTRRWSLTRCFEHLAQQRHLEAGTIRNAYYAHRHNDTSS